MPELKDPQTDIAEEAPPLTITIIHGHINQARRLRALLGSQGSWRDIQKQLSSTYSNSLKLPSTWFYSFFYFYSSFTSAAASLPVPLSKASCSRAYVHFYCVSSNYVSSNLILERYCCSISRPEVSLVVKSAILASRALL